MVARSDKPDAEEELASAAFADRVETISEEYRMKLQRKAATMREAVLNGETDDDRVLAVAEALEQLAGNKA